MSFTGIPTLQSIRQIINDAYETTIGADVDLSDEGPLGQIRDVFAEQIYKQYAGQAAVRNDIKVSTATGVALDLLAAIAGKVRNEGTFATIEDYKVYITGDTTIPVGFAFSKSGDSSVKFVTTQEYDLTYTAGSGTQEFEIDIQALDAGSISVADNTITEIDSPLTNLDSATNDSGSTFADGSARETDAELRSRIMFDPGSSITGTDSAMRRAILAINSASDTVQIENCFVISNEEIDEVDGRPGKSTEVVVYQTGGSTSRDSDVARAIANSKVDGTELVTTAAASYSETVTLDGGNTREIIFSRPDELSVGGVINVTAGGSLLTSDQKDALIDDIVEYVNDLGVGDNVVVFGRGGLSTILNSFDGAEITDYEISIDGTTSGSPSPANPPVPGTTDANIEVDFTEIATSIVGDWTIGDLS